MIFTGDPRITTHTLYVLYNLSRKSRRERHRWLLSVPAGGLVGLELQVDLSQAMGTLLMDRDVYARSA